MTDMKSKKGKKMKLGEALALLKSKKGRLAKLQEQRVRDKRTEG